MCGIFGCIGSRDAVSKTVLGLKSLEYRGYDSVGVATKSSMQEQLIVRKEVGKISEVDGELGLSGVNGNIAIGHTRWATHGKVTKENAHPHTDCTGKIAVVHNGIIENYRILKEGLLARGHIFKSETDTEIIPHMIEERLAKGETLHKACNEVFKMLNGGFAALVMATGHDELIAVKKGSAPLAIGMDEDETFVASDASAFMKYTNQVIFLADKDLAVIGKEIQIFHMDGNGGKKISRDPITVNLKPRNLSKAGFDHYSMKEITEQVVTLQSAIEQDTELVSKATEIIKNSKSLWLIASGTSYHACIAAKYLFSKIAKKHVDVILASEFKYYAHLLSKKTAVIAISQSGESYDVLEAVKFAKDRKCKIISFVNVPGSSLYMASDVSLEINAGPETSVIATKTYTSQLALINFLIYTVTGKQKEGERRIVKLDRTVRNLTSDASMRRIKRLALKLKESKNLICIGRGLEYVTAMEAALKIKEISYIHAEAFAGGELKHGSIALIENNTPCIVFVSEENEAEILSNAMEVKSRGGYIIGVSPKKNDTFDYWIKVPELTTENHIMQIIPMQILAYYITVAKGLDPDKPRNLAKSVTVK